MIDFIRHLLAVPLQMLVFAARILPIHRLPLLKAIWDLTADPQWGARLIKETAFVKSLADARRLTDRLLSQKNDGRLYLAIGQLELDPGGDPVAAYNWIHRARQTDCTNQEWLLYLELILSRHLPQCDPGDIADRILARNDLPMHYTATALSIKAQLAISNNDFDRADRILDRMLEVQDDANVHFLKWVCAQARNDEQKAEYHRRRFAKQTSADQYFLTLAHGWLRLHNEPNARECLSFAQQKGVTREQIEKFDAQLVKLLD
ncbi:hypothetical protein [Anaerohalosphaera lusitana]|nr:hypothetical protein [Anaerohalosphaera lusitana]